MMANESGKPKSKMTPENQSESETMAEQVRNEILNPASNDEETVAQIGRAIQRIRSGDKGQPMRAFLRDLARENGIELKDYEGASDDE